MFRYEYNYYVNFDFRGDIVTKAKKYLIEYPELIKEFDTEKNADVDISKITSGSHKKIWWKCLVCAHTYLAPVYNRTAGHGCPSCAGHILVVGKNDIASVYPELLKEWNYHKNGEPQNFAANSHKKAWWICDYGHEWQATVKNRTLNRTGCPECNKDFHTSFPEQAIFYYVKQSYPDAINGYTALGVEFDIYIPSKKIAIEYDGNSWHNSIDSISRDEKKNKFCYINKIKLIRVREPNLPKLTSYSNIIEIIMNGKDKDNQSVAIQNLLDELGILQRVDLINDRNEIYEQYKYNKKNRSLEHLYPDISKEWDYEKNGNIKPDMVFSGTVDKFWWKCGSGHSWQASVGSRIQGHGCPYCSGRFPISGKTDLKSLYPEIVKEWNYEKNQNLSPENVTSQSNKKVWWKCQKGHEWQSPIYARTYGNNKCPYCSNKKLLIGYNDLETTNPNLIFEWDYSKNTILPSEIQKGSHYKAWWKCSKCGHEWQAMVYSRNNGHGCPQCGKKKK